jgi:hypothetical protein
VSVKSSQQPKKTAATVSTTIVTAKSMKAAQASARKAPQTVATQDHQAHSISVRAKPASAHVARDNGASVKAKSCQPPKKFVETT